MSDLHPFPKIVMEKIRSRAQELGYSDVAIQAAMDRASKAIHVVGNGKETEADVRRDPKLMRTIEATAEFCLDFAVKGSVPDVPPELEALIPKAKGNGGT